MSLLHQTPLWLTAGIRRIEQAHSGLPLMERAGLATAKLARSIVANGGKAILIVAGPGNNGGDAFVAARHIKQWFHAATVVFAGDAAKQPSDAAAAYTQWHATGGGKIGAPPTFGQRIYRAREIACRQTHSARRAMAPLIP